VRRRRKSVLTYEVQVPASPLARVAESLSELTGKRSVTEWRRRCEASLRASRARRGVR